MGAYDQRPTRCCAGPGPGPQVLSYFIFSKNIRKWLGSSYDGKGVWGREVHQQVQHSESSTLHTLTPPDELIMDLVTAVKVALNEKY